MKVRLQSTSVEAKDIQTFHFEKPSSFRYNAGQFIELYLPHEKPDERGEKHWFTLSSSPAQPELSITTRYFGNTSSTFKHKLFALRPGDQVDISEPMGDFVLPKNKKRPLIFIAGGIGVTPFHSMLQWLDDIKETRDVQLLYAAHSTEDLIFTDLFERLDIDFITLVGKRLVAKEALEVIGDSDGKMIYLSGPEPMVETLDKDFLQLGIQRTQLVTDYFPGYSLEL